MQGRNQLIFSRWQNYCNLLYLTSKCVFKNFWEGNCPRLPPFLAEGMLVHIWNIRPYLPKQLPKAYVYNTLVAK